MIKQIVLAGGCFWGVDRYFSNLKGVSSVTSGYANGNYLNPTYEDVCSNIATHTEAVLIKYDSNLLTLDVILNHFFRIIDPFSLNKQGNDIGIQYRSGIYYENEEDHKIILNYINKLQKNYDKKIVVEVEELKNYSLAEEYHQDYLLKNPNGYCHINLDLLKLDERK